jgi:hypothetical protein
MERADLFVYHRGKGLIIILIHPKLLFRFKHTEEREVQGLENICVVRVRCDNFDVIFTQNPEYLKSDMSTAVLHEQHSFRLIITWISPQRSDVQDKLMANEVFKKRAIDIWLGIALNREILAWTMRTVIKAFRMFRSRNSGFATVSCALLFGN